MKRTRVHHYETCDSTGPQYLIPDQELVAKTIGETAMDLAKDEKLNLTPAEALIAWAFNKQKEDNDKRNS